MISWKELKLQRENRKLKGHVKACLELIEELSQLDAPLFEADLPFSFKKKYVRTIRRAKEVLGRK